MSAKDIIIDPVGAESGVAPTQPKARMDLVAWVMANVDSWRQVRDTTYQQKWDEYYRIWRGRWSAEQRNRKSERSKLISPATQVAVDLTVSELVEAVFGRESFIDLSDDIADDQKDDVRQVRDALLEDRKKDGILTHTPASHPSNRVRRPAVASTSVASFQPERSGHAEAGALDKLKSLRCPRH